MIGPDDQEAAMIEALPPNDDLDSDALLSRIVEFDEALAAGQMPDLAGDQTLRELPDSTRQRFDRVLRCLQFLDQIRRIQDEPEDDEVDSNRGRINASDPPAASRLHLKIGRFEVVRELGRGGHGVVFLANDLRLRRQVALKVPLPEFILSPGMSHRFVYEAQAAAALDHPNILKVFEAGEAGLTCYIASEYCAGPTLEQWLSAYGGSIAPKTAARIAADLTRAVGHAHSHGILHRDLKPSNVLLQSVRERSIEDSSGGASEPDVGTASFPFVIKLTDFGIAKVFDQHDDGTRTRTGAVIGSPSYMSPEQSRDASRVTAATDVYGVGATLYHLITGRPPFRAMTAVAIIQQVVGQEPVAPRTLNPMIDRDLETICLTCLAKEPEKRYATAGQLADDLKRYLEGRPIIARPLSHVGRAVRWFRRNPALSASLVAVALLVLTIAVVSTVAYIRQSRLTVTLRTALSGESEARNAAEIERRDAETKEQMAQRNLYVSDMAQVVHALDRGEATKAIALLEKHRPGAGEPDLRTAAWHFLRRRCHSELAVLRSEPGRITALAYSASEKKLAAGDIYGNVSIWDIGSQREICRLPRQSKPINSLSFSANDGLLAIELSDGAVRLANLSDGSLKTLMAPGERPAAIAFVAHGRWLAAPLGKEIKLWDAASGNPLPPLGRQQATIVVMAAASDGTVLATLASDGELSVWDVDARRLRSRWHQHQVDRFSGGFALSPSGAILATSERDGVRLWETSSGRQTGFFNVRRFSGDLAFCRTGTGREVVVHIVNETIRYWDAENGRPIASIPAAVDHLTAVAIAPAATTFATGSRDGTIMIWRAAPSPAFAQLLGHHSSAWNVTFSPDGMLLASGGGDSTVRLWNVAERRCLAVLTGHQFLVPGVAFSPDGKTLASVDGAGVVKLWNVAALREQASWRAEPGALQSVAYSPDGTILATCGDDRTVKLWDAATQTLRQVLAGHTSSVGAVVFSPDGAMLASASTDGTIRLWDWHAGSPLKTLRGQSGMIHNLAFSSDSSLIVAGGRDKLLTIWRVTSGRPDMRLAGHLENVWSVAYVPGSSLLISGSNDSTVRIWDPAIGLPLVVYDDHRGTVRHVSVSPDGKQFATSSDDDSILLWRGEVGGADDGADRCDVLYKKGLDLLADAESRRGLDALEQAFGLARQVYGEHSFRTGRIALDLGCVLAGNKEPPDRSRGSVLLKAVAADFAALPENHPWRIIAEEASEELSRDRKGLREVQQFARTLDIEEYDRSWLSRGHQYADRKLWADAERCFVKFAEFGSWDAVPPLALVALARGDDQAYRRICEEALRGPVKSRGSLCADCVAWSCAVSAGAMSDYATPLMLARWATEKAPTMARYRRTLGAVQLRARRFGEAIATLRELAKSDGDMIGLTSAIFLGLALRDSGKIDEARRWLQPARRRIDAILDHPGSSDNRIEPLTWDTKVILSSLRSELAMSTDR